MNATIHAFAAYLERCRREVCDARLFVLGHPAPDGDAVVSSLMEGWRRTLSGTPAVPVLQAQAVPREAAWLLGELSPLVLTAPEATTAMAHPDSRFVLTDHHDCPAHDRVVAVVDHHPLTPGTDLTGREVCLRPVGAATTLVVARMREEGLLPDAGVARILLGGILLDTDGLSPHKAKPEDTAAAGWLASLCGEDTGALYTALQEELLGETDVTALYRRDYRLYTAPDRRPLLGFAILKVWRQAMPDRAAVRRLLAEDVVARGCAACVVKIMLFSSDGGREEHYLVAGPAADTVREAIRDMAAPLAMTVAQDEVYLPPEATHRGRKWLSAKLLERLLQ